MKTNFVAPFACSVLLTACAAPSSAPSNALTLRPGQIHEECRVMKAGSAAPWQFVATAPLDFNVHYHVGKDVFYPLERVAVQEATGTFTAQTAQEYCWMWTNRGNRDVALRVQLQP